MGFDEALGEARDVISNIAFRNDLSAKDIKDLLQMLKEEDWE